MGFNFTIHDQGTFAWGKFGLVNGTYRHGPQSKTVVVDGPDAGARPKVASMGQGLPAAEANRRPPFIPEGATIRSLEETLNMLKAAGYRPDWKGCEIRLWGDDRYVPVHTERRPGAYSYWAKM